MTMGSAPGGMVEADGEYLTKAEYLERYMERAEPPKRSIADVEAKRRIVGRHDVVDVTGGCAFCGEPAPCEHLRILALPYADHKDYRQEWKP